MRICLLHTHTHKGNLCHPHGQHSYGHGTAPSDAFLPVVPSLNIRLIAGEGEQALQPREISKRTANVGNNIMLC